MPATIAILGGAGAEGTGLARRFAAAGHPVVIGSRDADRAESAAASVNEATGQGNSTGADNAAAAALGQIVVLTIPYTGIDILAPLAEALAGKIVVSTIVAMEFAGGLPRPLMLPEGSAAQKVQAVVPGAKVVGAFHHVSAGQLADLSQSVDSDILVCGDDAEAKTAVISLASELPGARGVDAGRLDSSGTIEAMTAVLLRINRRYRTHAALRITYLPDRAGAGPSG